MRALTAYRFDAERMKTVTMPTLLLLGQEHNAMDAGREALAKIIIEFVAKQ